MHEQLELNPYVLDPGGARVIEMIGPLTMTTMSDFKTMVQEAIDAPTVVLDLTNVEYVDSAGLGVLMTAYASAQKKGKRFLLVGVKPKVRELLRITHVEQLLAMVPTIADAKTFLSQTASA